MPGIDDLDPQPFGDSCGPHFEERLQEFEAALDLPLPPALVGLLRRFDGAAVVFGRSVAYRPLVPSPWCDKDGTQSVELVFGLAPGDWSLEKAIRMYVDRLPEGFLPFAEAPGGNLLCVVLFGPHAGKVYFWDHEGINFFDEEADLMDAVSLAAESLDGFFSSLFAEPDAPLSSSDGITRVWYADDLFDEAP